MVNLSRSQWPLGLRSKSAAARPVRLWVRIAPGAWVSVCCECCVLSGRGVLPNVVRRYVWSRNLVNEEALPHWGAVAPKTNKQQRFSSNNSEPRRSWKWQVNFMPGRLYFRERAFVFGPQGRTGSLGEEKYFVSLWRLEPQTVQPVAYSLYRYDCSVLNVIPISKIPTRDVKFIVSVVKVVVKRTTFEH
jgi:hypothetical protein